MATATVALVAGAGGAGRRREGSVPRAVVPVSRSVPTSARVKIKARDRSSRSAMRRLQRVGLRVQPRLEATDNDCVAHLYGEVRQFFREHPGEALYRSPLEVRYRYGGWCSSPSRGWTCRTRPVRSSSSG